MTDRQVRAARRGTDGDDTTVEFAAAPFATTSYARLRLIRQLHAGGLLSGARDAAPGAARRALPDGPPRASC